MQTKITSFILPRLQDILFFGIFFLVLALGQNMLNSDGDLPRHLLAGELIVQSRSIPATEPFIYPYAGQPYVSHEWLSDVIFYLIYHNFGLAGIVLLSAVLLATAFSLIYSYLSIHFNSRIPTVLLVMWGTLATIPNWITRPHLFSMLFLSIFLILTDKLARNEKISILYFPTLMLFWSNLHGEFIAGILVLIAFMAGWTWEYISQHKDANLGIGKKLLAALILSILASLLHPGGPQSWLTVLGFLNNRYLTSIIIEAQSPNFQQLTFSLLFGLLIFSIFLLAIQKKPLSTGKAFLLAGFSAMSLLAARNIHLYSLVAPFVLSEPLAELNKNKFLRGFESALGNIESKLKGIFWPITTIIVFCIILTNKNAQQLYGFDPDVFPVNAVQWLESHPQNGNMFNDINWGGYIALHLWPQELTFIDTIADFKGDLIKEYVSVMSLSDTWEDVFAKYNVKWVIVRPDSELAKTLQNNDNWVVLHEDNTAIVIRRHK